MTNATTTEIDQKTGLYDMKNLDKMKMVGAALAEGAIPRKYKELMALAVALTTQCPYCIELHSNKARELGGSELEMAETVLVAAALRAGAAVTHGTHAMKGI